MVPERDESMFIVAHDETGGTVGRVYRHHRQRAVVLRLLGDGPDIDWPSYPTSGTTDEKAARRRRGARDVRAVPAAETGCPDNRG